MDHRDLARSEFYGRSHTENLTRPGTSYSTKGPTNWRQTFKGFGANSSMVDLSSPMRKESVTSLRYQSSEANLRNPWMNSSTANLPLPATLGGSGPRVGTPDRPSTASGRTKEWINPLDVHFCKDPTGAPPALSPMEPPVKSPLGLEFAPDDVETSKTAKSTSPKKEKANPGKGETTHHNGYPSPPQSVNYAEQNLSPSVSNGQLNSDPASLPSPATSAPRTSEERWDAPVIRNVSAKRDTTTFHSPRRRSFTMDLEQQELEKLRKQRQTEGFAGSFADFDFGEIVTKQASIEQFPEPPGAAANSKPRPVTTAGPAQTPLSQHPLVGIPTSRSAPLPNKQARVVNSSDRKEEVERSAGSSPVLGSNAFELSLSAPVEAPKPIPERPSTSHARIGGAPAAAAGAHQGTSAMSSFEPPPRLGFRARLGSDASTRRKTGPPKPLKMPGSTSVSPPVQSDEPSPRSPLPPTNSTKQTVNAAPKQSLDIKSPKSPYQKTILEGDFPVTKGLPRGRQPPRRPPRSDEATSPERPDFSIPNWGGLDEAQPRHSAMPPPLATSGLPRPSTSSGAFMELPSPSFASLELDISSSGESLTQAFEEALGKSALAPGLVGDFFSVDTTNSSSANAAARVEAKKAPPRPAPVTLPPSPKKSAEPRSPAATQTEFSAGFI